jgi:predicted RNase H-like nuclease (RuvC/YqgF family)
VFSMPWKLGTLLATGLALMLGAMLLLTKHEVGRLKRENAELSSRIDTLTRDLGQCRANVATLSRSLDEQTDEIARQSKYSERRLRAAKGALASAQRRVVSLETRAAGTLSHTPVGADACARIDDVRRRYLEGLR